jgi:hypothetical protein
MYVKGSEFWWNGSRYGCVRVEDAAKTHLPWLTRLDAPFLGPLGAPGGLYLARLSHHASVLPPKYRT